MKSFSMRNDRRLSLWMDLIPNQKEYSELRSFLKTVLILSHGNSFAEHGFSVNKEMLIENLRYHIPPLPPPQHSFHSVSYQISIVKTN